MDDDQALTPAPNLLALDETSPQVGEVLAERYRLEEHIGNDTLGRQLWRGSDVILQRPVTVVLRYPGGDSAAEMLSAAVTASRIVHPHLIGVYDAIDEGDRAYVVREWVEGTSLRRVVAEYGPLESDKAVAIAHAIAAAISALHDTGMAHGNVQPGTVLIGDDGRVVLGDARADEAATAESDIRAIGAVLYCALTGHWPHAEAGVTAEPDGMRDPAGGLAAPHQVRAGVPNQVDQLAVDLLNPNLALPTADVLAGELSRLDNAEDHRALFADEPLDLDAFDQAAMAPESSTPTGRKMAIVIAALLVIAIIGTIAAVKTLGGEKPSAPQAGTSGTAAPGRPTSTGPAEAVPIQASSVRIVAPVGDRDNADDARNMVDGNPKTKWRTQRYVGAANFGNLEKKGLGVLVDLGRETAVSAVQLDLGAAGADVQLMGGATDPGNSREGDLAITQTYKPIGDKKENAQPRVLLSGEPDTKVRYLLIWFTKLPPSTTDGSNNYRLEVLELTVYGQQSS
jgi:hypothetical protein